MDVFLSLINYKKCPKKFEEGRIHSLSRDGLPPRRREILSGGGYLHTGDLPSEDPRRRSS